MADQQHLTVETGASDKVSPRAVPKQSPGTSPQHNSLDKDERTLAEEEQSAKGTWWGRFKHSLKPKHTTIKEVVKSAAEDEATYRFDFMDFELDILSITADEAQTVSKHQYCVSIERTALTVAQTQHGQTKWAGPAAAFAGTNTKLAEMRKQILEWENEGLEVEGQKSSKIKLSTEDINKHAEGSFFGVASSVSQGLELVRCPTDFGNVKEAERYIVRHRWAPSYNVIPVVSNIKRMEQLEETDPFGDTADTATPPATTPTTATNLADLMAGSDEENESPFANFQLDPNVLANGASNDSIPTPKFGGYSNQHRRHTATYGGGANSILSQAAAAHHHHQRTVSYGASSPSKSQGAATEDDILKPQPYITYNKTNQNCVGENSTPYVSTIGLNPCEEVNPKPKTNASVVITVAERTDVDLAALAKIGLQSGGAFSHNHSSLLPGKPGRKFTTVRLDLTKASISAFGGQRYELYLFEGDEESKKERKKMAKAGKSVGIVPSLVLRFKVQGTLIDRETHQDVTAQSPARRRLLLSKISDAPAFPYAFVLDQFVLYRNTKPDYNISAGLVKTLKGSGVAEVTIGLDGTLMDKKEKDKVSKKAKEAEGEESDDAPEEDAPAEPQSPAGPAVNGHYKHQTTLPTATSRMLPLHQRAHFKVCDHDDPSPTPSPSPPADKEKDSAASLSIATDEKTLLRGAGTHELKFEDLYECYVVTPQFATMKNYTIGDIFNSNSETFTDTLAQLELPSGITNEDVNILMKRPLIKMQCKTPDNTCKVYTQCIPGRGANLDFVIGSSTTPATPVLPNAEAKDVSQKAYNEMLFYPNPAPVQAHTSISLAPYINLNTFPVEGIPLSIAFPKKQSIALHRYEDEIMVFRLRRFLLPSTARAGLAPQTQWEIPSDQFESDDCPYRVYEDVLSLESFFEPLR